MESLADTNPFIFMPIHILLKGFLGLEEMTWYPYVQNSFFVILFVGGTLVFAVYDYMIFLCQKATDSVVRRIGRPSSTSSRMCRFRAPVCSFVKASMPSISPTSARCTGPKASIRCSASTASTGRAIQNMLNIDSDDAINACLHIRKLNDAAFCDSHYVMFCTRNGVIKKTCLSEYSRPRANGVNAITIRDDDKVISVCLTDGSDEIIIANKNGRAIRFNENAVRTMGRTTTGVRGITLDDMTEDEVIGMVNVHDVSRETIMVVSEQGFGKRSKVEDYRITNRGGKGVKTMSITDKTGKLVAIKSVTDDNDLMIINKSGITIRLRMADVRVMGRATQGVKLINLERRNDSISSVCKVQTEKDDETAVETYDTDDAAERQNQQQL